MNIENIIIGSLALLVALVFVFCGLDMIFNIETRLRVMLRKYRKAHEPRFKRNLHMGIYGVIPEDELTAHLAKRQRQLNKGKISSLQLIQVPKTMTFSSSRNIPGKYLTGSQEQMEELLKDCKVSYSNSFFVPFSSGDCEQQMKDHGVVWMSEALDIVKSARPKLVRNFVRSHWKDVVAISSLILMLVSVFFTAKIGHYYRSTSTVERSGYMVIYKTHFDRLPIGETLEELKKDPVVVEIAWVEDTSDPNIKLWYDWTPKRGYIHEGTPYDPDPEPLPSKFLYKNPVVWLLVSIPVIALIFGVIMTIKARKSVKRYQRSRYGNSPIENSKYLE